MENPEGIKDGWVKLWRKSIDTNAFYNPEIWRLWTYCLMRANHKEKKIGIEGLKKPIKVAPGQFITGRFSLARDLHKPKKKSRNVWKWLHFLEKLGNLTINSTNKYSLITITNWELYQHNENVNLNQKTNKRPTKDQQKTTNKNVKNVKEVRSIVELMNKILDTSFKWTTILTQKLINGRLDDGYQVDDFKMVIEYKKKEWEGTEQENYLRPQTLFRPANFESYLQQAKKDKEKKKEVIA